jgi:hypothetical protein
MFLRRILVCDDLGYILIALRSVARGRRPFASGRGYCRKLVALPVGTAFALGQHRDNTTVQVGENVPGSSGWNSSIEIVSVLSASALTRKP